MFNLGWLYHNGLGMQKNEFEAYSWFRQAGEIGNAKGMYWTGQMLENGWGVPAQRDKAGGGGTRKPPTPATKKLRSDYPRSAGTSESSRMILRLNPAA